MDKRHEMFHQRTDRWQMNTWKCVRRYWPLGECKLGHNHCTPIRMAETEQRQHLVLTRRRDTGPLVRCWWERMDNSHPRKQCSRY